MIAPENLNLPQPRRKTARMIARNSFAAASHDLRQPLHALAMFNAALKNKVKDSAGKKLIAKQESSISNMSNLLQDTLDTARADIGQKDPVWASLALEEMISDIASRFEMQARNRGIRNLYRRPIGADHHRWCVAPTGC